MGAASGSWCSPTGHGGSWLRRGRSRSARCLRVTSLDVQPPVEGENEDYLVERESDEGVDEFGDSWVGWRWEDFGDALRSAHVPETPCSKYDKALADLKTELQRQLVVMARHVSGIWTGRGMPFGLARAYQHTKLDFYWKNSNVL